MSAQGRGEAHSHAAAVKDTSSETWIVIVDLENVEARSVGHWNTSQRNEKSQVPTEI